MSDFIGSNLHKKVDAIMDKFYGAGVASHPTIIEQINYLLFMRALSQRDDELRMLGITSANDLVFDGELEKYRWENLLALNAEHLFIALEECFRKIPESTTNKTVRLVFRNAHIKLFDKPTLRTVVHEIDAFAKLMDESEHKGVRDVYGDTYEYLLSKLAQAGTAGQFRTPRHIIEFLVEVVSPQKGETIIDPAVGTAGFLVKAFEYLRRSHTSQEQLQSGGAFDKLSSAEHTFLYEHTFSGFDSDEDMIKFGMMNLYLHGLQNARLVRQNTLTDTAGSRDKYDIMLANPPFSGKIDRDSVAEELQMGTGATEVLFLRYMLRHLTETGRAGVIVPEGIVFNASGGHIKIREMLLDNGLWCVVSLPSGVFNPYAGVKTSILFFDRTRQNKQEVLFAKVAHDGFSLSAQRKPTAKNDLPGILEDIRRYKNGEALQLPNAHVVAYDRIKESKDLNLTGDRYRLVEASTNHDHPVVTLGEISILLKRGKTPKYGDSQVQLIKSGQARGYFEFDFSKRYYVSSDFVIDDRKLQKGDILINSTGVGTAGRVTYFNLDGEYLVDGHITIVRLDRSLADPKFVLSVLANFYGFKKLESLAQGNGGQIELSRETIAGLKMPLPPIGIQQMIVAELESYQKIIDAAQVILKMYKPTLSIKPDWKMTPLDLIVEIGDGNHSSNYPKSSEMVEDGVPFIRGINLRNYRIDGQDIKFISEEKHAKLKKGHLRTDDILFTNRGEIGKVAIVDDTYNNANLNSQIAWLRSKGDVMPKYLLHVLASPLTQNRLLAFKNGATLQQYTIKQLKALEIPLPSFEVQKDLVMQLDAEAKLIEANKKLMDIYEKKIQQTISQVWT